MDVDQLQFTTSLASFGGQDDFDDDEDWVDPPSPAVLCDGAVERGDVLKLFDLIRDSESPLLNYRDEFAKLQRLIESKMQDDLDGSIEMVLNHGCAVTGYLLFRLRFLMLFQIETADFIDPKSACPPLDRVVYVQQHIERIEQHLLHVRQQRAATKRLEELARAKRLENDRAASNGKPNRKSATTSQEPPTAPQNISNGCKPPTNGSAVGKVHSKRF
ncbi:MAG: hypothetical protein O2856_14435 [Planctomycetota bacterium]|nr:hypothetical protein [Planctomycetota bacterium]